MRRPGSRPAPEHGRCRPCCSLSLKDKTRRPPATSTDGAWRLQSADHIINIVIWALGNQACEKSHDN
ncbi:unnamed protein product [Urochloa humidicola]